MNAVLVLLDVISWPFYVMGGAALLLAIALVAAVAALTVAIIKRIRKK